MRWFVWGLVRVMCCITGPADEHFHDWYLMIVCTPQQSQSVHKHWLRAKVKGHMILSQHAVRPAYQYTIMQIIQSLMKHSIDQTHLQHFECVYVCVCLVCVVVLSVMLSIVQMSGLVSCHNCADISYKLYPHHTHTLTERNEWNSVLTLRLSLCLSFS